MAQDPHFSFRRGKIGGYHYDQVEDIYSLFPQVSASGEALNMDHCRVDTGTSELAAFAGPANEILQQSVSERGFYPNTRLRYGPTWGAHDSSNQVHQLPELSGQQVFNGTDAVDRGFGYLDEGAASGFSHLPPTLSYNAPVNHHNRGNDVSSASSRNLKRSIAQVDGKDDIDYFDSSVQSPERKRLRRTSTMRQQGTAPIRGSKQPDPARKRKTTTRPERRDRVQGIKGAEHNPKGMTRVNPEGQLEWRQSADFDWEPAGYHNDYRAELIALDEVDGESYDHQPAGGGDSDPLNITSYCFLQQHWTEDKSSILDEQGREVMYMLDPPDDWYHNPKVDPMENGGMIMLDHDDYPVRDFEGVPRVLSTHIEPWRLEGLRRCTGMTLADIRARMPSKRVKGTIIKDLQTPQAFTNRMNHWRVAENVGVWLEREGSQKIKAFIKDQLLDPEVKTTESLTCLGPAQQKKVYGLNKGQYLNKSRYEQSAQDAAASGSAEGTPKPTDTMSPEKRIRRNKTKVSKNDRSQGSDKRQNLRNSSDPESRFRQSNSNHQDSALPPSTGDPQATKSDHDVEKAVDYRFVHPSSASEATSVQAALYYTRADYASWTGEAAPATSVSDTYIGQYLQIEHQFLRRWNHCRGLAPTLMGVGSWKGGWDMWQKPNASEEEFSRLLPGAWTHGG